MQQEVEPLRMRHKVMVVGAVGFVIVALFGDVIAGFNKKQQSEKEYQSVPIPSKPNKAPF